MQVPLSNFYRNASGSNVIFAGGDWYDASSSARRTVDWNPAFTAQNKERDRGALIEYNQDLGFGTLTYLGARRGHNYYKVEPVYFLSLGQASRGQLFDSHTTSHELRLASNDTGALTWVAGLYRFDEDTRVNTQFLNPLPGPLQTTVNGVAVNYRYFDNHAQADSTAAFAQATYAVVPALRLTAGIRTTKDNKERTGANTLQVGPVFSTATDRALLNDAAVSYKKTNWKLGAEYDLNPNTMLYGSASTGYKAGGYNDGCLATTPGCNQVVVPGALFYSPESLKAYELGVKGRFFDRQLQMSVAAFRYDYTDMQLQGISAATGLVTTTNAAKSTINGVEAEGVWRLSAMHRLNFSLALLNAKYDDYQVNQTTNWGGLALDRSPKHSMTLGYQNTIGLESGANVVSTISIRVSGSSVFSNFSSALRYEVPSYTKSDATVTYNDSQGVWYVQGYVNNIENKVRPQGAVLGATFVTDPRTFGMRAGAHF
jgi:iron complex outermembrane receptor protein